MEWFGLGWLIGLTVPWAIAALWFSGLFLMVVIDPQGGVNVDHFDPSEWSHRITALVTVFVAPLGLGWAADAAGFSPWLWALYLLPYGIVLLIAALFGSFPLINWWADRARARRRR